MADPQEPRRKGRGSRHRKTTSRFGRRGSRLEGPPISHNRLVAEFYDRWTDSFIEGFGTTFQAGLVKRDSTGPEDPTESSVYLAERAGVRNGDRVLDAGCGVCGPAVAVALALPGVRVEGFTVSPAQARIARDLINKAGCRDRVSIAVADYHRLPIPDGAFDRALFLESCGYSQDRRSLFKEAVRVIRAEGTVYVKDVFRLEDPLSHQQRSDVDEFDELWALAASPTLDEVQLALEEAGCEILTAGSIPHVGTDQFVGAMFELGGSDVLGLSELGEHFYRAFSDLPVFFGEVLAVKRA